MPVMTEDQPAPAGRRGRYPKAFRRDAAALIIDQKRTVADVAKELGVVEPWATGSARNGSIGVSERRPLDRGTRGAGEAQAGGEAPHRGA
jgi:transposase-like protein